MILLTKINKDCTKCILFNFSLMLYYNSACFGTKINLIFQLEEKILQNWGFFRAIFSLKLPNGDFKRPII